MIKGKIILIPTLLGNTEPQEVLPQAVWEHVAQLKYFAVEELKTARRFLKKLDKDIDINALEFFVLNKHTQDQDIAEMIIPALKGNDIGIMSEAGLPGIADPGARLVELAHQKGVEVKPLSGPSSIFMALMASGLNGQSFAFTGYLPYDERKCRQVLVDLEIRSRKEMQSQAFMETPYRNNKLLELMMKYLQPATRLCIAADITRTNEFIATKTIAGWKNKLPNLHKRPAIFIIQK